MYNKEIFILIVLALSLILVFCIFYITIRSNNEIKKELAVVVPFGLIMIIGLPLLLFVAIYTFTGDEYPGIDNTFIFFATIIGACFSGVITATGLYLTLKQNLELQNKVIDLNYRPIIKVEDVKLYISESCKVNVSFNVINISDNIANIKSSGFNFYINVDDNDERPMEIDDNYIDGNKQNYYVEDNYLCRDYSRQFLRKGDNIKFECGIDFKEILEDINNIKIDVFVEYSDIKASDKKVKIQGRKLYTCIDINETESQYCYYEAFKVDNLNNKLDKNICFKDCNHVSINN